jgi:hypothetical protein
MYKYIVYCSISAVIIIVSKYVYQNWVKQNSRLLELQNNVQLLQNRVKQLEADLESQKVSGGVKIPVVFRSVEKKPSSKNINFSPTANTIPLSNDLSEVSESPKIPLSFSEAEPEPEPVGNAPVPESPKKSPEAKAPKAPKAPKSGRKSAKKTLQLESDADEKKEKEKEEIDLDNISGVSNNIEKELESESPKPATPPNSVLEAEFEEEEKKKKKPSMPDAKNYSNGEKIVFNDEEYICVVGKRGGHSWKKLGSNVKLEQSN